MGLLGILVGLALLISLAFRGWSVLLLAPAAAIVAALFGGEPLLANWTQIFMRSAAQFVAQFFPIFLLGALFGKLMDDSGSVTAISDAMTAASVSSMPFWRSCWRARWSPMAGSACSWRSSCSHRWRALFRAAAIPRRLMPAAIALGTSTFTMSALPGTPSIQNAIPMPFFGTTPFAAPGLGIVASVIMLGFGLWWLRRAESAARRNGEGFGADAPARRRRGGRPGPARRATTAQVRSRRNPSGSHDSVPPPYSAAAPLIVVVGVNLVMSFVILPRLDVRFLAEPRWGETSLAAVGGVWPWSSRSPQRSHGHLQLGTAAGAARQHGCRRQCRRSAGIERGELRRFRGRRCGTARLRGCAGLGSRNRRRSAGVARGRDQHSGRTDGLGFGRTHDRARRPWTYLHCARGSALGSIPR